MNEHWGVRCFIYDHHGAQVDTLSNKQRNDKVRRSMYAAMLLWVAVFAIAAMGLTWIILKALVFIIGPTAVAQRLLPVSRRLEWFGYAASGFFLLIATWLARMQMIAGRKVSRKVREALKK